MVQTVVNVETLDSSFVSCSDHLSELKGTLTRDESSGLGDHFIPEGVVMGALQSVDLVFLQISCGETTANVENLHGVSVLSSDFDASSSNVYCFLERGGSVEPRSAMEVNSF